jgi:Retrotransposon gag protein/Zinc knuckle
MDQNGLFAQFGDQAPAVQALLNAVMQPLQNQIFQLQQQIAHVPPVVDAQDIAAAVAAAVAQQAQPPAPREPKVADPPIFSGDRNEVQSFIRSVRTCFTLSPSCFPAGDEIRRILFALGFIQGGTAGTWANNATNAMLDPGTINPFNDFQEFQDAFERAFGALDRAQKARTDMTALKMKPGDSVEEYTTTFESLAIHTGYNEAGHIEAYRSGLLPRIVEKIYGDSNGQLPADLTAWKTKSRHLDNLYHEFKALQLRNPHHTTPTQRSNRAPPPRPTMTVPATTPTADAMDVDGHRGRSVRCYNCNKFGHIARNCPEPKKHRSIRTAEIAEVVRAVLAEGKEVQGFPTSQQ